MVVRDHDDAAILLVAGLAKEFHDLTAPLLVQGRRGLVGQDDAGTVGDGPSHRHPLLFPAGEHRGEVVGPFADAEIIEQFQGAAAGVRGAWPRSTRATIWTLSQRREERDQVGLLEDVANVLAAEGPQIRPGMRAIEHEFPIDPDAAGCGRVDQADGGQERRFAGTAGTEQGHHFAAPARGSWRRAGPRPRCARCRRSW